MDFSGDLLCTDTVALSVAKRIKWLVYEPLVMLLSKTNQNPVELLT